MTRIFSQPHPRFTFVNGWTNLKRLFTAVLLLFWLSHTLGIACAEESKAAPIVIGTVHSLSSWGAPAGIGELNAIRLAAADINAAGGVAGRPIKLISEDSRSDFNGAVSAVHKLITFDKVPVILGPNWSEFSAIVAPVAEKERVPMLISSGYSKTLTEGRSYIFTLLPSYAVATKPLAEVILSGKYRKPAMIVTENSYFEGIAESLGDQLRRGGVTLHPVRVRPELNDYRSLITKFRTSGVDGLVMFLSENGENAVFLRQAKDLGFTPQIFASNAILYDQSVAQDRRTAHGVIYFNYITRAPKEFIERYRQEYNSEPYFSSPQAYDSVVLLKTAMEQCGFESQKIRDCLKNVKHRGVSGTIQFGADNVVSSTEKITGVFRIAEGGDQEISGLRASN